MVRSYRRESHYSPSNANRRNLLRKCRVGNVGKGSKTLTLWKLDVLEGEFTFFIKHNANTFNMFMQFFMI